eukprot:GHVR01146764.1.p1 GENE.GHVR01146764.1~~GHVR01146764.1.p1  ORF type:complete len:349 (-),score=95.97 GHVR01146764.1:84-1130(-)
MLMQGYVAARRYMKFHKINSRVCHVLRKGDEPIVIRVKWSELNVEDIIVLMNGDVCPADVLLVHSEELHCFVEGSPQSGVAQTQKKVPNSVFIEQVKSPQSLLQVQASVRFSESEFAAGNFKGVLHLKTVPKSYDVDLPNIILRGTTMKAGGKAYCLVLNTGKNTYVEAYRHPHGKRLSAVEGQLNWLIVLMLLMVLFASIISTVVNVTAVFNQPTANRLDGFLSFLILYHRLLPISLYIVLDIVHIIHARRVESDPCMCEYGSVLTGTSSTHTRSQSNVSQPPLVATPSLLSNLGHIDYIMISDEAITKKGDVHMSAISVGGILYTSSLHQEKDGEHTHTHTHTHTR